jgi:hypothetical protein
VWCGRSVAFAAALLVQLGRLDSRVWGVDRWAWPHDGRDPECGTVPWPDAVQCLIASASELELELIQLVRARSAEACRMWDDATVDLVVLDADHTRQGTEAAIEDWRPTIRPGGWIAGHDWGPDYPGVAEAVLATWPAGRVERLGTCWAVQLLGPS